MIEIGFVAHWCGQWWMPWRKEEGRRGDLLACLWGCSHCVETEWKSSLVYILFACTFKVRQKYEQIVMQIYLSLLLFIKTMLSTWLTSHKVALHKKNCIRSWDSLTHTHTHTYLHFTAKIRVVRVNSGGDGFSGNCGQLCNRWEHFKYTVHACSYMTHHTL